MGDRALDIMEAGDITKGVNFDRQEGCDSCEGCARGKITRSTPKPISKIKTTRKEELVDSDACGPMHIPSRFGKTYMVTFTDDHTHIAMVYYMERKSEVVVGEHQIHHETTDPYTPEQNGVSERFNRTIIEKT